MFIIFSFDFHVDFSRQNFKHFNEFLLSVEIAAALKLSLQFSSPAVCSKRKKREGSATKISNLKNKYEKKIKEIDKSPNREFANFKYILTNKPFGDVKAYKVPKRKLSSCNCDPNSANPCSNNDCLNRALKFECKEFNFFKKI